METRNRSTLFKGLVVNLEQMEVRVGRRGWHTYQIVRHPGGVGVLPMHDDGSVTLIRQLRPAVGGHLLEIPAGRLQPGEEPAACGGREMAEETGLFAGELLPLGIFYPSPGVFDEVIHLFLGTGLSQGAAQPEPYEEIETVRMPIGEALRLAVEGTIRDGKTIAALMRAGNAAQDTLSRSGRTLLPFPRG
ncbi:MAG: NUDIX hydrolase [Deltaproteobacteria bacterium]